MNDRIENKSKILTYLLVIFFLFSPIDYIMPHFGSATILTVVGLGVSAFAVFFAFGNESAKVASDQTRILLLMLLMIISNIWAQDTTRSLSYTFSFVATSLMFFMLFFFKFSKEEIELMETVSIIGGAIFVLYVFTQVDLSLVRAGYRLQLEQVGNEEYFADPNGLAARLMMPLIFVVKRIFGKVRIELKVVYCILLATMIYIIFLTGSRAAVIALAVAGLAVFFAFSGKKASSAVTFIAIALVVVILVPNLLPEHIFDRIFNFEKFKEVMTVEGDRIDIWKNTIFNVFPRSPICGHGAGNSSIVLADYYGRVKAVHSSWFTMLGDLGFVGFVLWMSLVMGKTKEAYAMRKSNMYPWAILIVVLIMASTLDAVLEKYLWNAFLYVHMINTTYDRNDKKIPNEINTVKVIK